MVNFEVKEGKEQPYRLLVLSLLPKAEHFTDCALLNIFLEEG